MSINKLSNYTLFEPSVELGKEKKTSDTESNKNITNKEISLSNINVDSTDSAAKCNLTDQAKCFQQACDKISNEPYPIDLQKIAATIEKIRTGQLGILKSNIEERLVSAEKIANALLEMDN